jgi:extradiol dioxygenase family protein
MEILQTVPILRVFDVAKAKEFYLDYLGCVLHLSEHYGDVTPGAAPWNARVMQFTDPFGNRLRFNEDLK